eukprot:4886696-Amphidinium_carterae.1
MKTGRPSISPMTEVKRQPFSQLPICGFKPLEPSWFGNAVQHVASKHSTDMLVLQLVENSDLVKLRYTAAI